MSKNRKKLDFLYMFIFKKTARKSMRAVPIFKENRDYFSFQTIAS